MQSYFGAPRLHPCNSISINASQTLTHKVEQEKNTILQAESTFLLVPDDCFNLFLNYTEYHKMWTFSLNIYFFILDGRRSCAGAGKTETKCKYNKAGIFDFI